MIMIWDIIGYILILLKEQQFLKLKKIVSLRLIYLIIRRRIYLILSDPDHLQISYIKQNLIWSIYNYDFIKTFLKTSF